MKSLLLSAAIILSLSTQGQNKLPDTLFLPPLIIYDSSTYKVTLDTAALLKDGWMLPIQQDNRYKKLNDWWEVQEAAWWRKSYKYETGANILLDYIPAKKKKEALKKYLSAIK
jgi:hypothetical protein